MWKTPTRIAMIAAKAIQPTHPVSAWSLRASGAGGGGGLGAGSVATGSDWSACSPAEDGGSVGLILVSDMATPAGEERLRPDSALHVRASSSAEGDPRLSKSLRFKNLGPKPSLPRTLDGPPTG